jgi:hypothetical protein
MREGREGSGNRDTDREIEIKRWREIRGELEKSVKWI